MAEAVIDHVARHRNQLKHSTFLALPRPNFQHLYQLVLAFNSYGLGEELNLVH